MLKQEERVELLVRHKNSSFSCLSLVSYIENNAYVAESVGRCMGIMVAVSCVTALSFPQTVLLNCLKQMGVCLTSFLVVIHSQGPSAALEVRHAWPVKQREFFLCGTNGFCGQSIAVAAARPVM